MTDRVRLAGRVHLVLAWVSLLVACSSGDDARQRPPSQAPKSLVMISGNLQYEFAPAKLNCRGLDLDNTILRPIRQASVQLLDESATNVLASGISDNLGNYSLLAASDTNVVIRVRAELQRSGSPAWNVSVRDNTLNTKTPLGQRPVYAMDTQVFNTGGSEVFRNLTATTGWDPGSGRYTGDRVAAPFAILDTLYGAMSFVLDTEPGLVFPRLVAYWSVNNRPTEGGNDLLANIDKGDIGTSFYLDSQNGLFLLGDAATDTEEFDDHVIAHEWAHYFENKFSRSDSIGGPHIIGEPLDARLAFGEGWATALAGVALGDPLYCDTGAPGTGGGFGINVESSVFGRDGWYNEMTIVRLLYDLWDTDNDGPDDGSVGFAPVYGVLTGEQASTAAFATVFSFATALKARLPAQDTFIDRLLADAGIEAAGIDDFGSGETNDMNGAEDVLPLYTVITPGGDTVNVCSNSQFDRGSAGLAGDGNKLSEHRLLRMTVDVARRYTFSAVTTTPMPGKNRSDPDILYYRNGALQNVVFGGGAPQGLSDAANQEIFTTPTGLQPGEYVIDLWEWRFEDEAPNDPINFPARVCFDVTIDPS